MKEDKQASNVNEFNRYLNNNTDTLHQKFVEHHSTGFPMSALTSPPHLQQVLDYIYDIFNFHKYRSNPELNQTLCASLTENLKDFQKNSKTKAYDQSTAVELLKYCIENNDMFAVHYDKKKNNQEPSSQQPTLDSKPNVEEQPPPPTQQPISQDPVVLPEPEASPPSPPRPSPVALPDSRVEESQPMSVASNQFQAPPQRPLVENTELIRKQLKGVFEFYCKQQQNVGPNFTFDNISHKCQTMNLGKFVTFAVSANIVHSREKAYSQAKLEKGQIVSTFKKIAEGEREIGFATFIAIMQELKKYDPSIYQKLGLGEEGAKGRTKLLQKLKYLNHPFSTRDPQGREIPNAREFVPKLTSHSGKSEEALRDELSSRRLRSSLKQEPVADKMNSSRSRYMSDHRPEEKVKMTFKLGHLNETLQNSDLNFLSKLIAQDDHDQIFLKDYRLPPKNQKFSERQRLNEEGQTSPFGQNIGGLMGGPHKKQPNFILPSITKRGGQTEVTSQRRSLNLPRRPGTRLVKG